MGIIQKTYKPVISLLLCVAAGPVLAAEGSLSPFNLNAHYMVAWGGIPLGRITITAKEDAKSYQMSIDTKTKGIAAMISDEARTLEGKGTKSPTGDYIPLSYVAKPHPGTTDRTITLTYDNHGKIKTRVRELDDDPAWRPPVNFEEINAAHDPINGIFTLRRQLYNAVQHDEQQTHTNLYDGARLAKTTLVRSKADTRVMVMDSYQETIPVGMRREPINGYTPKELKKYKKGDPDIRIYFSNDNAFIPVRATATTVLGELSMSLEEIIN